MWSGQLPVCDGRLRWFGLPGRELPTGERCHRVQRLPERLLSAQLQRCGVRGLPDGPLVTLDEPSLLLDLRGMRGWTLPFGGGRCILGLCTLRHGCFVDSRLFLVRTVRQRYVRGG